MRGVCGKCSKSFIGRILAYTFLLMLGVPPEN